MRRVMVIGSSGAGKSTFSKRLGASVRLPVVTLDYHHWGAGWTAPATEDWRRKVAAFVAEPAWIMDGTFPGTFDLRMPRADTLIWLDYPRALCLRRAAYRILSGYGRVREGLPDGCPEHLDFDFFRYIWRFPAKSRPQIERAIATLGTHLRVIRLRRPTEADAFLSACGQA